MNETSFRPEIQNDILSEQEIQEIKDSFEYHSHSNWIQHVGMNENTCSFLFNFEGKKISGYGSTLDEGRQTGGFLGSHIYGMYIDGIPLEENELEKMKEKFGPTIRELSKTKI